MYLSWLHSWNPLTRVIPATLTMFQRASCDVPECLAFSVFKCPHTRSTGLRSGDFDLLWSSSDSCKALRCVWTHYAAAVWILLQTRECSMPLKNRVLLLLGQGVIHLVQVSKSYHHISLWDWFPVVSFSLLFVSSHTPLCYCRKSQTWLIGKETFFPIIHCQILALLSIPKYLAFLPSWEVGGFETAAHHPLRPQQNSLLLTQLWLFVVLCVVYITNSVSVLKFLSISKETKLDVWSSDPPKRFSVAMIWHFHLFLYICTLVLETFWLFPGLCENIRDFKYRFHHNIKCKRKIRATKKTCIHCIQSLFPQAIRMLKSVRGLVLPHSIVASFPSHEGCRLVFCWTFSLFINLPIICLIKVESIKR